MGIARTLQYGGKMDYPLIEFLKEYHVKLLKLFDQFYTDKARVIAQDRKIVMEEFYQQLLEQMDLSETNQLKNPCWRGSKA